MEPRRSATAIAGALASVMVACGGTAGSNGAVALGGAGPDEQRADPLPESAVVRLGTTRLRQCDHVTEVSVAPRGTLVAAADRAGCVRTWSGESGRRLASHRLEGEGGALSIDVSQDGRLTAAGGADGTVLLFESDTGRVVSRGRPVEGGLSQLRFLGAASSLVGVDAEAGRLVRIDVEQGGPSKRWSRDLPGVERVHVSPDGSQVVVVAGGRVRILDAADGADTQTFRLPGGGAPRVARSLPSGDRYAVATRDAIHVLDASGEESARINIGLSGRATGPEASGEAASIEDFDFVDAETMVVLPNDGTLRLVDLHGNERRRFEHGLVAHRVRVSPTERLAVLAGDVRKPYMVDLSSGRSPLSFETHDGPLRALAISPDGSTVATGADDGTVRLWRAADGRPVMELEAGLPVDSVAFVGGEHVVSGDRAGELVLWRLDGTAVQRQATAGAGDPEHAVRDLTADREGTLLVSTNGDNVQFWEHSADRSRPLEEQLGFDVTGCGVVALSPDGRTVAASSRGERLVRYRPSTEREQRSIGPWAEEEWGSHAGTLRDIAWGPAGERIATVASDRRLRVWAANGENLAEVELGSTPAAVAWSPDGEVLAVGGRDGLVALWALQNGGTRLAELRGHEGAIVALVFSPDGRLLFSASEDETALGWDVASVRRSRQGARP